MRAASKLEQAHPHARRKTTSSPVVKPLLPLNVMPFPNINDSDPASTSALDVEDGTSTALPKWRIPVPWRQPAARDVPLQHGPDRRPGTRQLQELPRGASAEADATRERAPASLIALPAPAPLARALPAPSSRVQQPRMRVCMLPMRARGRARGVALALAVLELAVQRRHEGRGPARKRASPRTRPDPRRLPPRPRAPRRRGSAARPARPAAASTWHCANTTASTSARAPARSRAPALSLHFPYLHCVDFKYFASERHVSAHQSADLLAAIALSHDFQKWKWGG
ncbi:hypothetical protein GGX14DRAFT_393755 [Mycena pura]|uniref:Uncharacterized protein n=1 Tax=Mycena pura TaxID=153505 RepID=A0AAD6VJU9_9AGAR|nr:hypothetical protein GGX14DRAFT_393755 [Mycena pura]